MQFQKSLSGYLAVILMVPFLTGCGAPSAPAVPDKPITMDYQTTGANLKYFTEGDSWETLAMSGPYYMGLQQLDQPVFTQYDLLRSAKIAEAQKLTADVYNSAMAVETKLRDLKGAYLDFFDTVLSADQKLLPIGKSVAQNLIEQQLKVEGLKAAYDGHVITATNPVAKAFVEYQKTLISVELAGAVNKDVAGFISSACQIVPILMASENTEVASAAKDFDGKMDSISDLNGPLSAMQNNVGKLSVALRQLNTGEHFMGLGTLAYVTQELPALKEKAAGLTPNESVTADDIAFIQGYADVFGSFAEEMNTEINNTDASTLYLPPAETSWIPNAKAEGYFDSAMSTLSTAASYTGQGASMIWSGTKSAYGAAKTGAGYTLDSVNALVKSGLDVGFGIANGVSTEETAYQIRLNYGKVYSNYKKGTSGSEVLKTAGEMLDSADAAGQQVAKTVVEGVADVAKAGTEALIGQSGVVDAVHQTGKEWVGWGAGHLGKMTVGMFTGFGKGLYKVSNTQATTGQLVEGTLDIGLSFIGGSKIILKGSQAAKGGKEALKLLGEKGINMTEKALANSKLAEAKALAKEGVEKALGNEVEIAAKEALKAQLESVGASISQRFSDLLSKGGKTVFNNTLEGKTAYKEFVKDTFEKSLAGYKEALLKVTGDNMKDYVDNLVASKADDLIKAVAADFAQKGIIPGFGGPFDGHYKGQLTITKESSLILPADVLVTNGVLDGKMSSTFAVMGTATALINITLTGDVDVNGEVSGECKGTSTLTGPGGSVSADVSGTFKGVASANNINLSNVSITISCIGEGCSGSESARGSVILNKIP